MHRSVRCAAASFAACAYLLGVASAADGPVFVVVNEGTSSKTAGSGSVALLHAETFETVGRVDLGLVPGDAVLSPGHKLLYVFASEKGAGPRGSLAVVEVPSGRLLSVVDAGEEPGPIGFAGDGRLFCLSRGTKERKGLVTIIGGPEQARLGRLELPAVALDGRPSLDGKRVYVLHGPPEGKDGPPVLNVLDTETRQATPLPLMHAAVQMALSPDGRWVYVLDRGDSGKKKDAAVIVVDAGQGRVAATLAVGRDPTRMRMDRARGRVYVGGRDSEDKKGLLLGIQGDAVFAKLDLSERPYSVHLAPDGSGLWVVGGKAVLEIDPDLKQEQRRVPLDVAPLVSANGVRRLATFPQAPGMGGGLIGAILSDTIGAHTVDAERSAVRRDDDGGGPRLFDLFARRHDGKFVYGLGFNEFQVLDVEKMKVTQKLVLSDAAYEVVPAANGRHAYVKSIGELAVIDLYKNAILMKYPLANGRKGLLPARYPRREMAVSDARRLGLVADGKQVLVINLRTGELLRTLKDLPSPAVALVPRSADEIGEAAAAAADAIDRALVLEAEGQREQAVEQYRKALAANPRDWTAVERLVDAQFAAGKDDDGVAELRRWFQGSPSNPRECWLAASRLMGRKQYAEASVLLQCALKSPEAAGPPVANLHIHAARAFLATNDTESARRHAEEARKLKHPSAKVLLKEIDGKK